MAPANSAMLAAYDAFIDRLSVVVEKQLTQAGKDSIRYMLITGNDLMFDSTGMQVPLREYSLEDYGPPESGVVQIANNSAYAILLINRNDAAVYTTFLQKGKTLQIKMAPADRLSFYAGSEWYISTSVLTRPTSTSADSKAPVNPVDFSHGEYLSGADGKSLDGVFTEVDTTTLSYLRKSFQYRGGTIGVSDDIRVFLTSPVGKGLHVAYDSSLFVLECRVRSTHDK
jgi:hypothetical protein